MLRKLSDLFKTQVYIKSTSELLSPFSPFPSPSRNDILNLFLCITNLFSVKLKLKVSVPVKFPLMIPITPNRTGFIRIRGYFPNIDRRLPLCLRGQGDTEQS